METGLRKKKKIRQWLDSPVSCKIGLMNKNSSNGCLCVRVRGQVGGPSITTLKPSGSLVQQLHVHEFAVKMAFAVLSAPAPVNLKCWVKYF